MTYDVFISYARKDGLEFAERLERDLAAQGYSLWRDKRNLDVYQDFTAEIEIGIRESRFVVVCVSPSIEQNPYSFVRREISYARSKNKPIIPLVLPNADLPLDIINLTWIGCFDGPKSAQTLAYEQGFTNLLTRLTRNDEPGSRPTTSSDPYREYVEGLYEGIVNLLDQTMIKLIDVRSEATPSAVQGTPKKHNPLAAFKGRYGMKADAVEAPVTSFREAYERYQGRVLLLGEPGAGKSTTLLSFARDAAAARLSDPTQPLPLLARCAMWDSTAQTPIIEWMAQSADLPATDFAPLIQSGKTILLLDALDEMGHERIERKKGPDGQDIEERHDPRKRFLPLLPAGIPLVLSCRIKDYAELGETLPLNGAVTLQPLTDDQIQHYLSDITGLWDMVQSDPALLDIARTPLLLSIMAFAFRDAPDELKPRADLSEVGLRNFIFDRYVRERYSYEQNRNDEPLPFTMEEVQTVLGHVAMINASGGRRELYEHDIVENVLERRDFDQILSPENIDRFIEFALLLDVIIPAETSTIRFIHLNLRDAFAYAYCLPRLDQRDLYGELWYPSPAKALSQVADEAAVLILSQLLLDRQQIAEIRQNVIQGLSKASSETGRAAVVAVLQDRTDAMGVRMAAAIALGWRGGEQTLSALLAMLQDRTDDSGVRAAATIALGKMGGEQALSALLAVFQDRTDAAFVRRSAAEGLGKMGGEQVLSALVAVLQDRTDDEDGRAAAAWGLGEMGDEQALSALLTIFQDRTDDLTGRYSAAIVLGSIGGEQVLFAVLQDRTDDAAGRTAAAIALGKMGGEQALSALVAVLQDQTDDLAVQAAAARGLVEMRGEQALSALVAVLQDRTNATVVRCLAASSLGEMGGEQALRALLVVLQDRTDAASGRAAAAIALGKIGGEQALSTLVAVLQDRTDDEAVRRLAAGILSQMGGEQVLRALVAMLQDRTNDEQGRDLAASALGKMGEDQALVAVLQDRTGDAAGRYSAAWGLGNMGEEQGLREMGAMLQDRTDDAVGRAAAIWGLGHMGGESAAKFLIEALLDTTGTNDPFDDNVRICDFAAKALKYIGTPEALAAVAVWEASQPPKNEDNAQ